MNVYRDGVSTNTETSVYKNWSSLKTYTQLLNTKKKNRKFRLVL